MPVSLTVKLSLSMLALISRRKMHLEPGMASKLRWLPDYLAPGMKLLFIGINPGLLSAEAGHYYANPRNLFWRLLYEAGLTPVLLRPDEDARIIGFGYGLTDIVKRPSRGAAELKSEEFAGNRHRLVGLIKRFRPRAVCFNSKTAFEGYFGRGTLHRYGPQRLTLEGRPVFVLPSTSPANATVQLAVKRRYFKALKKWLDELDYWQNAFNKLEPNRKRVEAH